MSSAWSADKAAVPLGRRIPTAGVLFRSDSLLDRFPYEDIGPCLSEEGSQHQVRQPRRKKERVCVIRRTRPREASLTGITEPSLPQLLWEGASLPFDRLNKPALPSTQRIYIIIWLRLSVCMYVCLYVYCSLMARKLMDGFSKFKRHKFRFVRE